MKGKEQPVSVLKEIESLECYQLSFIDLLKAFSESSQLSEFKTLMQSSFQALKQLVTAPCNHELIKA